MANWNFCQACSSGRFCYPHDPDSYKPLLDYSTKDLENELTLRKNVTIRDEINKLKIKIQELENQLVKLKDEE